MSAYDTQSAAALGAVFDGAITIPITASTTLTQAQWTIRSHKYTGVLGGAATITLPLILPEGWWLMNNQTTGGFALTFIGATGTGITLASGSQAFVYTDGVNVYSFSSAAGASGPAGGVLTGTYPNPGLANGVVSDANVAVGAAIAWSKISPNIVNANVAANAAIDGSKVNPQFVNQQVTTTATVTCGSIKATSLAGANVVHTDAAGNFSGSPIVNADVAANAGIIGAKIYPDFGAQNVVTTGTLGAGATTVGALGAGNTSVGTLLASGAATLQSTLGVTGTTTLAALDATSTRSRNLTTGSVKSDNAGNLSTLAAASITGVLSNVLDANAQAVMNSIIAALVAANIGINNTT